MKILVIEDDADLRENILHMLAKNGYSVAECADGEEGLYYITNNTCDLVVLDRMLPGIDGIGILRHARKAGVATPVLLLTAMNAVGDRVDGLEAGADDYLVKPFDMRELLARVRALTRRPAAIEQTADLAFGDLHFSAGDGTLAGPGGVVHLSKRLAELMELFLRNHPASLSRHTIFNRIWGPGSDVEDSIIDTYISLLRRRLKAVDSSVQIITRRGIGYRLNSEKEE